MFFDIVVDRLKNVVVFKKLVIFDVFEILSKIEEENNMIDKSNVEIKVVLFKGFVEGRLK